MKARILHKADDTTTEMVLEGYRLTGQIFKDGRGLVQVFDEQDNRIRRVVLSKVYLIDITQ